MTKNIITKARNIVIRWAESETCGGNGYFGWISVYNKDELVCKHEITICESSPIGKVSVILDNTKSGYGCWAMLHLDKPQITHDDLQWATHWAECEIGRKHTLFTDCQTEKKEATP